MAKKLRQVTPKIDHVARVAELLTQHGYKDAGQTAKHNVRIPTVRSPVFGGIGGEAATFGGRTRFEHPKGHRVTIGKRTTNFYQWDNNKKQTINFSGHDTKDVTGDTIKNEIKTRHGE